MCSCMCVHAGAHACVVGGGGARGTCVVVGQEGDSAGGPPAHEARLLAVAVPQAPVLAVAHRLAQDALGYKVEQGAAPRLVQPVAQALPRLILVVLQAVAPPGGQISPCVQGNARDAWDLETRQWVG